MPAKKKTELNKSSAAPKAKKKAPVTAKAKTAAVKKKTATPKAKKK